MKFDEKNVVMDEKGEKEQNKISRNKIISIE